MENVVDGLFHLTQNSSWNKLFELKQKQSLTKDNIANLLFVAAENDHIDLVKDLLQCMNLDVNKKMPNGSFSLHMAAQNGCINVVKELLSL
jgi:ankyrin repeat protein